MRQELISEVELADDGRLLVRPTQKAFDDLHTTGGWGFRWDASLKRLAIPAPREGTYGRWFEHLVTVICSQYGISLATGTNTLWSSVPQAIQQQIEAWEARQRD